MSEANDDLQQWIDVSVKKSKVLNRDTLLLELEATDGRPLPPYEPGAHLAVECGAGVTRHYSLTGARKDDGTYELGIKLAQDSRGGSKWIFNNSTVGSRLRISLPRNHFPLVHAAPAYLFLSGGIGITPLLSMLYHLREEGIRARLVHMARCPADLAFQEWLTDLSTFHDIRLHFDSTTNDVYDLKVELSAAHPETAVYCCGPEGMMKVVQQHGRDSGRERHYHFEFFSATTPTAGEGGDTEFTVIQGSTGRLIPVPKTKTMLAAIREAGVEMQSECEYGVCGWCAVPVSDGQPLHFDSYLTSAERASNKIILPCVSRCSSPTITLEI